MSKKEKIRKRHRKGKIKEGDFQSFANETIKEENQLTSDDYLDAIENMIKSQSKNIK